MNSTNREEFWSLKHQREFLDDLAVRLKITKPEDWKSIKPKDVIQKGGSFLRKYYRSSLSQGRFCFHDI